MKVSVRTKDNVHFIQANDLSPAGRRPRKQTKKSRTECFILANKINK